MVSSGLLRRVALVRTNVSMSSLPIEEYYVRFEVFTAVTMKNGVFWVVTPCGSCKNQEPHGVTTQKTQFFTVVVTSSCNLLSAVNPVAIYSHSYT
jgi:hypothetical protein